MDVLAMDMNAWMRDCCFMAAAAMNAWIYEYVSYGCVVALKVAINTNVLEFVYIRVSVCYCINA